MDKLDTFIRRLKKIGIEVEIAGNFPWLYLHKVNGKRVTEKYYAKHGFTMGFVSIRTENEMKFTELSETFKVIRKYK